MYVATSRRMGSPACPGRNRIAAVATASCTGRPFTVIVTARPKPGASRAAHAARSAPSAVPSPFVSMFGISWNVGISAMSRTRSTWSCPGTTVTPV